jgi:hypothetical protein
MAYNNFTLDSVKNQFQLKLTDRRFCLDLIFSVNDLAGLRSRLR